jgi:hypothetical protein
MGIPTSAFDLVIGTLLCPRTPPQRPDPRPHLSVPPGGIEPPTHGLGNRCSSPLSYGGEGRQAFYEPLPRGLSPMRRVSYTV